MLTVIGCGNTMRRDDGVGVVVAQRVAAWLRTHPLAGVRAFDCGTAGFDVLYRARGSQALYVVDASQTGAVPGTILELPGAAVTGTPPPSADVHQFRWDHALALGKALDKEFPTDIRVILVEAADLDHGVGLSAQVAQAADRVYERLLANCTAYACDGGVHLPEPAP